MAHPSEYSSSSRRSDHVPLASVHSNQRDHDAPSSDALRRVLLQQGFMAKPTAYAPYGKQEDHPLHDPHRQLQARLQAVRDVRRKLRFVTSPADLAFRGCTPQRSSDPGNDDVDMTKRSDSMTITTRVALSAQATADDWVQRGGIVALDGLETLFLGFLTAHELVTVGAVCQSWYALARRDVLWEPLLLTPVEKYPLRAFLGFHATASVPAIQVYIIYRKIRSQLQTLDTKGDEAPRQSADALRFEETLLRGRRAGGIANHNQNNNNEEGAVPGALALLVRAHGEEPFLPPPPLAMPVMGVRQRRIRRAGPGIEGTTTTTTTATAASRNLHRRSVHLVFPADEDLGPHEDREEVVAMEDDERLAAPDAIPQTLQPQEHHERVPPFFAAQDDESDEENQADGDVAMLTPDGTTALGDEQQPRGALQTSVLDACRRVRLQTWLSQRRVVSRDVFRSLARQLLLSLATLEVSQAIHSDVCIGNILVLERGTTQVPLPHTSQSMPEGSQSTVLHEKESQGHLPLFQLYCRNSVNVWSAPSHTTLPSLRELAVHPPPPPPPPPPVLRARGHADALVHRIRQRHQQRLVLAAAAATVPPPPQGIEDDVLRARHRLQLRMLFGDDDEEEQEPQEQEREDQGMQLQLRDMFPQLFAPPARDPRHAENGLFRLAAPVPPLPPTTAPAPAPPAAAVAPLPPLLPPPPVDAAPAAAPMPMPIPIPNLAPVAPVYPIAPQAPSSATLTSMVRSYLRILREVWSHGRVATTNERMLPFLSLIFLRPELVKSVSFRSFVEYIEYLLSRNEATPTKLLHHIFVQQDDSSTISDSSRFTIGRSGLTPLSFANAEDYRANAIAWHGRYLASRQAQHLPHGTAMSLAALGSFGSLHRTPSTLFGPAFFHDALSESRLPFQRFLSVAAPRTATSSWVHTLAVSQRFTLQQLDLSRVQLPLSILLRELVHLQRLSHLRLPRAILRDENMEQFIAALWCSGLLPTLEVMDDSVKLALDRMEASYVTQLDIMTSFLDQTHTSRPSLHPTFSSPF